MRQIPFGRPVQSKASVHVHTRLDNFVGCNLPDLWLQGHAVVVQLSDNGLLLLFSQFGIASLNPSVNSHADGHRAELKNEATKESLQQTGEDLL